MSLAIQLAENTKFAERKREHRYAITLFSSIIEQTHAAVVLLVNRGHGSLPIILRASLEAYVDLANLCAEPSYADSMEAAYHDQWVKLLQAGKDGDNAYLTVFAQPEGLTRLAEHTAALSNLKTIGARVLSNRQKFERAGLGAAYTSIYNDLCAESHNNLRALQSRHMREDDGKPQLVVFEDAFPENLDVIIDTFAGVLSAGAQEVNAFFGNQTASIAFEIAEKRAAFARSRGEPAATPLATGGA